MKVIIAGTRTFNDWSYLDYCIRQSGLEVTEVVSGGCRGADRLGEAWADANKIPKAFFYADWNTHGPAAGPIRNQEMAEYAEALIAFWDGESKGTADMIQKAHARGLPVRVYGITRVGTDVR